MQMDAETEARENADLTVYLNDHLSGAAAGLQLARSLRDNHEGTDLGEHMRELAAAIDEDRELLASLMDQIGAKKNPIKAAGAVAGELLTRAKFNLSLPGTGSSALARFERLEMLSVGIEGKCLLWRALAALDRPVGELDTATIRALEVRAMKQRDELEPYRVQAAMLAF